MLRVSALGLVLAVAVPNPALANGPCVCFDQSRAVPAFTRNLPLNARVFVSLRHENPDTVRLLADSAEVPIATFDAGGRPGNLWIEPLDLLLPGVSYQLVAGGVVLAHLETAQAAGRMDRQPPSISGITFTLGGLRDNCGPVDAAATLNVENYWEDMAVGGGTVLQLDVAKGDGSSERLFLEHSATFQPWSSGIGFGGLHTTGSDCLGNRRVTGATEGGRRYEASATIWDWSGNSSTVSELSFALEPTESSGSEADGCSATGRTANRFPPGAILTIVIAVAACGSFRARSRPRMAS
jgi:hypothetical protein